MLPLVQFGGQSSAILDICVLCTRDVLELALTEEMIKLFNEKFRL
jgi:hypothetical protein